jgi:LuxR family maltose regulon positive regulatory protein
LSSVDRDVLLILDDYHLVSSADSPQDVQSIHRGLAFLLEQLPRQVHLVLSTRVDPPLPLARLRARGELIELRAADLRFAPEETRAFLNQTLSLDLANGEIAALESRTEGWIAGLQLAGVALQHLSDHAARRGFVDDFAGSDRFVVDYLAEEVLQHQTPVVHDFLVRTCILERMSGPPCDALISEPSAAHGNDSQALLELLERTNLFVEPLDRERQWFRYHQLFADVLRARLQSTHGKQFIADLRLRAAKWLAEHSQPAEAIGQALAGEHFAVAATLMEQQWVAEWTLGLIRFATLERWLASLPQDVVRASPILSLYRGSPLVSLARLDLDGAEFWLSAAEEALDSRNWDADTGALAPIRADVAREIARARAELAAARGDADGAVLAGLAALDGIRPENIAGRCNAALALSVAYTMRGELEHAQAVLDAASEVARGASNGYYIGMLACSRAYVQRAHGLLGLAVRTCQEGLASIARESPGGRVQEGWLRLCLADLYRERNELDAALDEATAARARAEAWGTADCAALSLLVLARVQLARGDLDVAGQLCTELRDKAATFTWLADIVPGFEHQLRLRRDGFASGSERVSSTDQLRTHSPVLLRPRLLPYACELLWAEPIRRLLVEAQSRADQQLARRALVELELLEPRATWLHWLRIKSLALRALALGLMGDEEGARGAIESAVALAEPEGFVRVFVDEGRPMLELLRRVRARRGNAGWATWLMGAFGDGASTAEARSRATPSGDVLTGRELEVLRLLAVGKSNAEIAAALVVAASTVKTHVNNLFGKLGASNRFEAVARARELHLL